MAKNRKLKPLKGGLNEPTQIAVTDAATVPVTEPVEPVAVAEDGTIQPLEILGSDTPGVTAEPTLHPDAIVIDDPLTPRQGMNAAQVMEQAATHEIDEITIMAMTDIFAECGLEVVHDPQFNYLDHLKQKGGDPTFASDKAFSLARSQYLQRRQAMFDGMEATNADSTTTMFCVMVGNARLDPYINKDFLQLVHPAKHSDVLKAYPFLGESDAEKPVPEVDVVKAAKTKPAKPAQQPPVAAPQSQPKAHPKPKKEEEMKVKRSLLNAMFAAMKFKVPEKWPAATMLKHIKTLPKTVTETELSLVKKKDKDLLALLKALINLVEEGRAGSIEITDDSKQVAKAASKPAKPAKRSRDDDEDEDEEDEGDEEESEEDEPEDDESEDDESDDDGDEEDEPEDDEEDEPEEEEEEEEDEEEAPRRKKTKPAKKRPARDEDEDEEEEEEPEEEEDETDDEDEDDEPRRTKKSSKPSKEKNVKKAEKKTRATSDKYAKLLPKPGSYLKRVYKGNEIKVKVERDGFTYKNKKYDTIRAVAEAITKSPSGTNGWRFFGLI